MSDHKNSKSHYETLGLEKSCTEKEIKDAFLKLSKAHHPDMHLNDPLQKEKFVQIYEAYSVLSKPGRRVMYDSDLHSKEMMSRAYPRGQNGYRVETDAPHYTTWKDESIYSMRDKTSDNFNKPYYGIKGIQRVSNYWIAGGACVIMLIGALFHYAAFKHSKTFTVAKLNTSDEKNAHRLFVAQHNARRNGNEMQIRLMMEKLEQDELSRNGTGKDER